MAGNENSGRKREGPDNIKVETVTAIPAPEELTPVAARKWLEITERLAKANMLSTLDIEMLAAFCSAYSDFVKLSKEAETTPAMLGDKVNPIFSAIRLTRNQIKAIGSQFGFSPVSRASKGGLRENNDGGKKSENGIAMALNDPAYD